MMPAQKIATVLFFFAIVFSSRLARSSYEDELNCIRLALSNIGFEGQTDQSTFHPPVDRGPKSFLLSKKDMPWTANSFALDQGGIAIRWQKKNNQRISFLDQDEEGKRLDPKEVLDRLRLMTPQQLNKLSPIEKYDILAGHYDFRATHTEVSKRGVERRPRPAFWEGFCNGVCAASIALPEPKKAVRMTNGDGISLNFEPNDIKGLASASYFYVEKYAQIGSPNRGKLPIHFEALPNPGAFDWALTHYLGQLHRPFVVDVDPGAPIFNLVAIGYSRKLGKIRKMDPDPSKDLPPTAVSKVTVKTTVIFAEDNWYHKDANSDTQAALIQGRFRTRRRYVYKLYLDRENRIVGGKWPKKTELAPDFIWFPSGKGTDAVQGLNPYLDFDVVKSLVDRSSN